MAMSNSMDISSKNGITLSKNIAQLSADLASFYNTDVDSAFEALNSVFTGQVRTLRQYGLNISEANLEQYRLAKGIKVAYSAMTEQQKVLLRYNYIMEHTRDIQGDFAKTSATVANQWRLLQMNAKSLAGTLGSFLLPVLQTVLTYLNAIIRALNSFFGKLAQMVGITTPSYAAGIAVGNEVAEGWDNAAGAAAKYKATIAGFDELETLNPQGGGSGGGAGAGGLTGEDLFPEGLLSYDVDDNTKQLDLSFNHLIQLLDDKIQEIRGKAEELSGAFGEKVNGFVNYVDWPLMGKTVGDGLNLIVNAFDRFLEKIDFKNLGSKFAEGVNSIFSTVEWDEIGHNFSLRFNAVFDTIRGFLDKFDFSTAAASLLTSFKTSLAEIKWEEAGETIGVGINKAFGFLNQLLDGSIVSDLGKKIGAAINKAVATIDASQIKDFAVNLTNQIIAAVREIDWSAIGEKLREAFLNADVFGALKEAIKTSFELKGDFWGNLFNIPPGAATLILEIAAAIKVAAPIIGGLATALATLNVATLGMKSGKWLLGGLGLKDLFKFFKEIPTQIKDKGMKISDVIFGLENPINDAFGGLFYTFKTFASEFSAWFAHNWIDFNILVGASGLEPAAFAIGSATDKIGLAIGNFVSTVSSLGFTGIMDKIGVGIASIGSKLTALIAAHPGIAIVAGIAAVIGAFATLYKESEPFRNFVNEIWENTLKPTLEQLWETVKGLWNEHLKPLIKSIWEFLKAAWGMITAILAPVMPAITTLITSIITVASGLLKSIGDVIGGIIDILTGVLTFLTGVFTGDWSKAWEGIKKIFTGFWDSIEGIVKIPVNAVIGLINGMIGGITSGVNAIVGWVNNSKVANAVAGFFGKTMSIPKMSFTAIPYLASGGILDSPTVAMLGEYANAKSNPEIAAPQSLLEAIVGNGNDDVISVLIPLLRQINASIEDKDFSITIGDDTIAASAQRGNKNYQRRTGKTLFGY